ncbi:hypothetical protein ASE23_23170 [Rhizobium sp. Root73]|uniref:hypothetical protein n=1 Tax=unclassified Rhizobium TaxID=2613769 RepID=UPI000728CFC7|nr:MULTISPECIES: hypothetical protein [unclassified Rhizobium]KQY16807.1 hypothetical protein ASD36_22575 [Rhizobium sp. Root1334]KRC11366.1 hypothetical protein ASE23_23170 [Rhizobium sp. Root73]
MTDDQVAPDTPIEEPAPLVDEALAATDRKTENQDELRALRLEVARLKDLLHAAASGAGRLAMEEFRSKVRVQPIAAAAAGGFLAFLYGVTR